MPRVDTAAPADAHLLEVTRRFGDMDLLGHVNNVRYLDYVTAGRAALVEQHAASAGDVVVRRHRVGFVAPMTFGRAPAQVRSWVVEVGEGEVRLAHEVLSRGHHGDDEPTVHLRTESLLALPDPGDLAAAPQGPAPQWREVATTDRPARHTSPVDVRDRDLGVGGVARDDAVMEFFQESRVRYFMDLHRQGEDWGQVVVAHTDLDLVAPVRAGAAYDVRSWLGHLGTSSFAVRSDLVDAGGATCARASVVMVCFDASTQRPAPMAPAQRARLEEELAD